MTIYLDTKMHLYVDPILCQMRPRSVLLVHETNPCMFLAVTGSKIIGNTLFKLVPISPLLYNISLHANILEFCYLTMIGMLSSLCLGATWIVHYTVMETTYFNHQ